MTYAPTDLSHARRFSQTTYALLGIALVIILLLMGTFTRLQDSDAGHEPFQGFTTENIASIHHE